MKLRLAMVTPRYGPEILGGAETFARHFAEELNRRSYQVDALTTCARDHTTWRNELPAGSVVLNGVTIHRFPIQPDWESVRYHSLHARILLGQRLPIEEQYEWLERAAHSPELYAFIQRHQRDYDYFIFLPYLFPTTLYGASIAPHKSIIWSCLHDENYARLHPVWSVLTAARGLMFNATPERELAHRLGLYNPGEAIVGFGFSVEAGKAERFRQETGLRDPFLLYSGRLEGSKNVPLLVRYFVQYKQECGGTLKLALMGTGPEPGPAHPDVIRLGFRQGQAKQDAYAAALALCQPSVNESFSIVIMESWLARVPVLAHAHCAVTRYHVERSCGGLYFSNYPDFVGAIEWLLANPPERARLGENGQRYVTVNYNWDAVVRRFEAAVARWRSLNFSAYA